MDRVFYAGQSGATRFFGNLPLSDGTILIGGAASNLDWVPQGTPVTQIGLTAENGTILHTESVNSNVTAFVLHVSQDASQVLRLIHFPHGSAFNVTHIKTDTAPTDPTGNIYLSGQRGGTGGTGGYFIARLNANFITGTPSAARYFWNINTRGRGNDHGVRQPWDVYNDGRIIAQTGRPYEDGWAEIIVLAADPGPELTLPDHFPLIPQTGMPGFRVHTISDGNETIEWFWGTEKDFPPGFSAVDSRMVLKTQRTGIPGMQRSFNPEDFHRWQKDENGFWRRGTYPLDAFWWDYWWVPSGGENNQWAYHSRGYTGYRLAGVGNAEGAPYTPRVGAITVDRRNNHAYIGLNWQSRLPATNNPDFEPALIALDGEGYMIWWARMYREYGDTSDEGPQNIPGAVDQVPSGNQIQVNALIGQSLNIDRKTSGSDGYINGYRRLYWMDGAANHRRVYSQISGFDSATGTLTFVNAPDHAIQPGDPFLIDGTEMTRTHTSTPDQYIDAIAIDYSTPLDDEGHQGIVFVGARAHGNNVVNFWRGNEITANPGGNGFVNQFTGSSGNIHQSWLGKYRDEGDRSTILAATYVAEYVMTSDFGDGDSLGQTDRSNPNHDFWPNQNGGWPNRNTTGIGAQMSVNAQGQVMIYGFGRTVQTTANAFHRNIRPFISGTVSGAVSTTRFTAQNMIGANLILTNCRVRLNGQIRNVIAFDNDTGEITVDQPFPAVPAIGADFRVDEGVANWGNFVRVYSSDLSRLEYSTLLSSQINPVDGAGVWRSAEIGGIWPLGDKILVSGYHAEASGNPLPTANPPNWGSSSPTAQTDSAFFAILVPHSDSSVDTPPVITQTPQPQTVTLGGTAQFAVTATGIPAPTYQWYRNGAPIPGATNASLEISNVRFEDEAQYHVRVTNSEGYAQSDPIWLEATVPPPGAQLFARINFQNDVDAPQGWLRDIGQVFGDRGNGFHYGWNGDNTAAARRRNLPNSTDFQHDTLLHMQLEGTYTWEIAVPNGSYQVRIVAGDPGHFDSVYRINVEDSPVVHGTPTSGNRWIEGEATVEVTDGRLTVSNAPASENNKINLIEIHTESAASSGYDAWALQLPVGQRSKTHTFGGAPNLLRYALGGNASTPANALQLHMDTTPEGVLLDFPRVDDSALTYEIWWSPDLEDWGTSPVWSGVGFGPTPIFLEMDTTRFFFRLQVVWESD
ncbi:MAG: immunoglobulin domain-containing protein [Opitutales bacterium]|nr:immunoglobulin domain-containing protein [Opitutales bacterium]